MGFGAYLLDLLSRPFKAISDVVRFTTVIGSMMDETKQMIFAIRRSWHLRTCPVALLREFGDDYNMPQLPNETDEQYRQRLMNVFDWYYWMGTNYGILQVIEKVIDVKFQIEEYQVNYCWKLGTAKLGVDTYMFDINYLYFFGILFERVLTPDEESIVTQIVNIVKPAHTRFIFQYPPGEEQIFWRLGISKLAVDTIL